MRFSLFFFFAAVFGLAAQDFLPVANFSSGTQPTCITAGDLNNDGKVDLIVGGDANTNNIHVLLSNGDGTFQAPILLNAGQRVYGVAVADFNADSKLDIVAANFQTSNVSFFAGAGDGQFAAAQNTNVGTSPRDIVAGDFNADGKFDFIVVDTPNNSVQVCLGNGNGTFQTPAPFSVGANPLAVATGILNDDAKPDLAVVNFNDNTVSILLATTNGNFSPATNFGTGSQPSDVTIGKFNNDNISDLAVCNSASNNVSILIGNGNGTFTAAINYSTGLNPRSVVAADLNQDGKQDLAVANFDGNTVSILYGSGTGTFQTAITKPVATQPNGIVAITANAGSAPDLVTANSGSNNVSALLNVPDAKSFVVTTLAVTPGIPFSLFATAVDADGTLVPTYTGTIHFASSDSRATLPVDFTFTLSNVGTKSFEAILKSAGTQTITVTSTGTPIITGTVAVQVANIIPAIGSFSVTPTSLEVNQAVTCTATASDENGDPLSYTWNFGDGSSASGTSVQHAYQNFGTYSVSLTVNDGTANASSSATVTVVLPPLPGDSDGDGFSDALELLAGTLPNSAASTPIGSVIGTPNDLIVKKLTVSLNFKKANFDNLALTAVIPTSQVINFQDKVLLIEVSGITQKFTLTAKGKSNEKKSAATVMMKQSKRDKSVTATIKLSKRALASTLNAAGLVNADIKSQITLTTTLIFDGAQY